MLFCYILKYIKGIIKVTDMTYSEKLIALGLNIAYYRKLRLMTQEKLAEKADISISTIRKLENPNLFTGVTFDKICRLAQALEITESQLLDFRKLTK